MLTALALLALLAVPALAQEDMNCPDFDSQAEAQQYFEANGGSPTNNVDGLDRDNDGVACEDTTGYPDPARDETPATEDGDENGDGTDATENGEEGDDGEDNGDAETAGDVTDDQQDMPEEMPDNGGGALASGSGLPWGALAAAISLALAGGYGAWRRG
jgi:hypothetical protein